jgi:hypothetical protein
MRPAALAVLIGFVLGCSSTGPSGGGTGDGPDLKPDFSTLLGTYRVDLTQVYMGTAVGHYEGSVTLGQLTHVDTSHTDVSGDFAGSVQLTGTIPSFGPAFGSFSPVTVRAQWRPEGHYDLSVVDDLPLGVDLLPEPAMAMVTWTLLPGVYSYHDSSADRTIAVQREPDDTNLPYPNAGGLYHVTGTYEGSQLHTPPNDTFTGTLKLQQANRQSGVLTGSATINGFYEDEFDSAKVSTSGVVSFRLGEIRMNNNWEFTGTLSQNTITGRQVEFYSFGADSGSWQATR